MRETEKKCPPDIRRSVDDIARDHHPFEWILLFLSHI